MDPPRDRPWRVATAAAAAAVAAGVLDSSSGRLMGASNGMAQGWVVIGEAAQVQVQVAGAGTGGGRG